MRLIIIDEGFISKLDKKKYYYDLVKFINLDGLRKFNPSEHKMF